jgi:nitroreductase
VNAIDAILTRTSVGALTEPAPPDDVLALALQCALAAPDHGRLRPARFVLLQHEARARLGQAMADALRKRHPDTTPANLERETKKPLRAPLVIVAACAPQEGTIPLIEQLLSVGASVENMLLALHAQGFGAMWRTGDAAYDDDVKRALGLAPTDQIVGFVYVGTPASAPKPQQRTQPPDAIRRLSAA